MSIGKKERPITQRLWRMRTSSSEAKVGSWLVGVREPESLLDSMLGSIGRRVARIGRPIRSIGPAIGRNATSTRGTAEAQL
jgi:hypothetical protein